VAEFQAAVISAFDGCGYDYEIVFVDDGSKDAPLHNLRKLHAKQECPVKVVSFSRNFGKEAGLYAGLQHASGNYISLIDADLQQRPEIVRDMVQILDENPETDVVAAYQDRRNEGKVLSFFKKSFYAIINKLSKVQLQPDASDFRTFRRSVADSILKLGEYHRFSKGIFAWVGYETKFIPYTACERMHGTTKWNFWKLFNYAVEGIIGYSTAPLRLSMILGCVTAVAAVLYLVYYTFQREFFLLCASGALSMLAMYACGSAGLKRVLPALAAIAVNGLLLYANLKGEKGLFRGFRVRRLRAAPRPLWPHIPC
jgi:glycosyltransferase involved in cell wall biosynthesis